MVRRLKDVIRSRPIGESFAQLEDGCFEFLGQKDLVGEGGEGEVEVGGKGGFCKMWGLESQLEDRLEILPLKGWPRSSPCPE